MYPALPGNGNPRGIPGLDKYPQRIAPLGKISVTVEEFGAKGGGVVNDTLAIQKAIDFVSTQGGGSVVLTKKKYSISGIVLKSGVILTSGQGTDGIRWAGSTYASQLIRAADFTDGWLIDTPSTGISNCGITGVTVACGALTSSLTVGGIRFQNVTWGLIEGCSVGASSIGSIKINGVACVVRNNGMQNFWQFRNGTGVITSQEGVLWIQGTDHWIENNQANGGIGVTDAIDTTNFYKAGVYVQSAASWFIGGNGEFSECGWAVFGNENTFIGVRGDTNPGRGIWVKFGCTYNSFTDTIVLANGLTTDATVDHIYVDAYATRFKGIFIGPDWGIGGYRRARYGIVDAANVGTTGHGSRLYANFFSDINYIEGSCSHDLISAPTTRPASVRRGGAGNPKHRPPSRWAAGETWVDTTQTPALLTFSDGTKWLDSSGNSWGNLYTTPYSQSTDNIEHFSPYSGLATSVTLQKGEIAFPPGLMYWARNAIHKVTVNASAVTAGYAAVIMGSSGAAPVTAGQAYKVACEVRGALAADNTTVRSSNVFTYQVAWLDSGGVTLSTSNPISAVSMPNYNPSSPTPTELVSAGTVTAPSGAVFALPILYFACASMASGDQFWFASPAIMRGSTADAIWAN